ncbi:MAG: hypothetical protein JEZ07_12920 [Phycisphaerae bacterium]|nr:hypothetical protein [Phycisphaerae bacterium]
MDLSINTKIRLALIIIISVAIFGCIGLAGVKPQYPQSPITILSSGNGSAVIGYTVILSIAALAIAFPLAGRKMAYLMPLAVPAGLAVWSMATNNFNQLLLDNLTVEARSSMFRMMAAESFIWFVPVMAAFVGCWYFAKKTHKDISIPQPPNVSPKQIKNSDQLLGLAISVVVAFIVLKLTARVPVAILMEGRQGVAYVPALHTGQMVFAVLISFFLGSLAAQQLVGCTLLPLFFGPLIVSVYNYFAVSRAAVHSSIDKIAPHLMPSGTELAMILPLQYIAIGALAIHWGYWYSIQLNLAKHFNLYEMELTPDPK